MLYKSISYSKYSMVFFDCDGVIIDSTLPGIEEITRTIANLGLKSPGFEFIRKHWGLPYNAILEKIKKHCDWGDEDLQRYYDNIDAFSIQREIFPGMKELVDELKYQCIERCIISSRKKESLIQKLREVDIDPIDFLFIQGLEDCEAHKPDPKVFDNVFALMEAMGLEKDTVVFVGDALKDFHAARLAGIDFIAIVSGAVTREEFFEAGIDSKMIFEDPTKILSVILER